MKNFEKFKDKIFTGNSALIEIIIYECYKKVYGKDPESYESAIEWLYEEYKIELTQLELEILKRLKDTCVEYLARNKDGRLFGYVCSPLRGDIGFYTFRRYICLDLFNKDFKFVTWDNDPIKISDILENYIIVKDKE